MAESKAFQQAYQKKREADAGEVARIAESNRRLEELWGEFVAMSGDLQRHGVTFEWGRTAATKSAAGETFERVIVLRQGGKGPDYANAIVFGSEGYRAWGAFGSIESDDYKSTLKDVGRTAAEAASTLAERLVSKDALPAGGRLPSFVTSERDITRGQREDNLQLAINVAFYIAIAVGLIWLFS